MKTVFSVMLFALSMNLVSAQRIVYQTNSGGWVQQQQHVTNTNSNNHNSQGGVNAQVQGQSYYGAGQVNGNVQGNYNSSTNRGQTQTVESYQTNWQQIPNSAEQTYDRQRVYGVNNNGTLPYIQHEDNYYRDANGACYPAPTAPSHQFYNSQPRRRN